MREPRYAGQTGGLLVFAEDETPLRRQDVQRDAPLIAVIEVRGLRYTSSSMRLELVLRQVMVLKDLEAAPAGCMISVGRAEASAESSAEPSAESLAESSAEPVAEPLVEPSAEPLAGPLAESSAEPSAEPLAGPLAESSAEPTVELEVVEPTAHTGAPVLGLRTPAAVYQELYEETYRRAQAAKQRAVALFLEANEMCSAYGLDEIGADTDEVDQLLA